MSWNLQLFRLEWLTLHCAVNSMPLRERKQHQSVLLQYFQAMPLPVVVEASPWVV
jgi:hypothetical protein